MSYPARAEGLGNIISRKQELEEKQLCEYFKRQTSEISQKFGHGKERENLREKLNLFKYQRNKDRLQ